MQPSSRPSLTYVASYRLASGDIEGRVVIWDVSSGTVIASLEDPLSAALSPGPVARKSEPGKGGAVKGLAWIMSNPCVLGIVLTSGMFLVWDPQGVLPEVTVILCSALLRCLWNNAVVPMCFG